MEKNRLNKKFFHNLAVDNFDFTGKIIDFLQNNFSAFLYFGSKYRFFAPKFQFFGLKKIEFLDKIRLKIVNFVYFFQRPNFGFGIVTGKCQQTKSFMDRMYFKKIRLN